MCSEPQRTEEGTESGVGKRERSVRIGTSRVDESIEVHDRDTFTGLVKRKRGLERSGPSIKVVRQPV